MCICYHYQIPHEVLYIYRPRALRFDHIYLNTFVSNINRVDYLSMLLVLRFQLLLHSIYQVEKILLLEFVMVIVFCYNLPRLLFRRQGINDSQIPNSEGCAKGICLCNFSFGRFKTMIICDENVKKQPRLTMSKSREI